MDIFYILVASAQYLVVGLLMYIWRHEMTPTRTASLMLWVFLTQFSIYKIFEKKDESRHIPRPIISNLKK